VKTIFVAVLLCLISLPSFAADGKESAYDRVIETGVLKCGVMLWPPYFEKDAISGRKAI